MKTFRNPHILLKSVSITVTRLFVSRPLHNGCVFLSNANSLYDLSPNCWFGTTISTQKNPKPFIFRSGSVFPNFCTADKRINRWLTSSLSVSLSTECCLTKETQMTKTKATYDRVWLISWVGCVVAVPSSQSAQVLASVKVLMTSYNTSGTSLNFSTRRWNFI